MLKSIWNLHSGKQINMQNFWLIYQGETGPIACELKTHHYPLASVDGGGSNSIIIMAVV